MIDSGHFLSAPSRPLKRSQLAPARATLGPFGLTKRAVRARSKNAMRSAFAVGLLITLCASADAATVQRSRAERLRARQHVIVHSSQGVTAPARFAVPGWTEEQTQQWLDNATSCEGCG